MKNKVYGNSSERRLETEGLPLFQCESSEKEALDDETVQRRKKRVDFGRTPQPELPRVEVEVQKRQKYRQKADPQDLDQNDSIVTAPGALK